MIQEGFDKEVMEMLRADEIRSTLVPDQRKSMYFIDTEWKMLTDPFRIQWVDPLRDKACIIFPLDLNGEGEQYAMFTVYEEAASRVILYIFDKDKYVTEEE